MEQLAEHSEMSKATYSKKRRLQVLLAGTEDKNFVSLRDLLTHATGGNLQLNCAHSCQEVRTQLERGTYHMLLGDCESSSDLGLPAEAVNRSWRNNYRQSARK